MYENILKYILYSYKGDFMDLGNIFLAKALYNDATGIDKLIDKELAESAKAHEDLERDREARMRTAQIVNLQGDVFKQKISEFHTENQRLFAELEVMRQVVAKKNEALAKAKENLESFHKLSIVLSEQAEKEKKEKEILKNMLLNANFLELAEVNETLKDEIAGERAFLHKWILSRNSFWEMAYRMAKEQGLDITMEDLKARADQIKDELIESGFSAPEFKDEAKDLPSLTTDETQKEIINEEIKRLSGNLTLDQKLELANIDMQMNLIKQGIDPNLPLKEQIKP